MDTALELRSKVDKDGQLKVQLPEEFRESEVDIRIVRTPPVTTTNRSANELGWSAGFFERTAGAWQGELKRPVQGEFDLRTLLK